MDGGGWAKGTVLVGKRYLRFFNTLSKLLFYIALKYDNLKLDVQQDNWFIKQI